MQNLFLVYGRKITLRGREIPWTVLWIAQDDATLASIEESLPKNFEVSFDKNEHAEIFNLPLDEFDTGCLITAVDYVPSGRKYYIVDQSTTRLVDVGYITSTDTDKTWQDLCTNKHHVIYYIDNGYCYKVTVNQASTLGDRVDRCMSFDIPF